MNESVRRILVVDDEPVVARFLRDLLQARSEEFRIETALDGGRAIEKAVDFRPHVVVLDVNIPGADGYEVCSAIHAHPRLKHTVVLAITADPDPKCAEGMRRAGAVDCLIKPFPFHEFLVRVTQCAEESLQRRAVDEE